MKISKLLLFLIVPFVINSCHQSDDEPLGKNSNPSNEIGNMMSLKEGATLYEQVVEAEDQFQFYNALNAKQKAAVWQEKYDDFIENSILTTEELAFVNRIKNQFSENFFTNIEENYNTDEIKLLEIQAGQMFGTARGLSLFYSMETVYKNEEASKNCFWCNNLLVSVDGDCHIEYFNGVPQYVEAVTIKKVRFWITVGTYTSVQACTP